MPGLNVWLVQSSLILLVIGTGFSSSPSPHRLHLAALCTDVEQMGSIEPELTDVEKRLVCGDLDEDKKNAIKNTKKNTLEDKKTKNDAWKSIPFSQAKYNLRNFLQERGYLQPKFIETEPQSKLVVDVGLKTRVTGIILLGSENRVEISRKRKTIGEPLTPALLNDLEKWIYSNLRKLGYPCPIVKSVADIDSGVVRVSVELGFQKTFGGIKQEPIPGLKDQMLRRYDAFNWGEPFNGNLLAVTENRVKTSGIIESTSLAPDCSLKENKSSSVSINQLVVSGAPRLLIGRIGLNTEGLVLGSASWKNTRMGELGSQVDLSAFGSARKQSLAGSMSWYFLNPKSRTYFSPLLTINHRNESQFESLEVGAQFGVSSTMEVGPLSLVYFTGPVLSAYETIRGPGALLGRLLYLENRVTLRSHDFEFYAQNPQSGFNSTVTLGINHNKLLSDVSAQHVSLKLESIWNLFNYDPPLWIIGLRTFFSTLLMSDPVKERAFLPATYFQYLGGAADLRGFGRLELSDNQNGGGITLAYLGLEFRLSETLPAHIDPFLFFDFGKLGSRSFQMDSPFYWSPGFGIRWASPIGSLRATLAHGFSDLMPVHWQFFLSLGEEF